MTLPSDISHDRVVRALQRAGFSITEGAKHTLAKKNGVRTTIPRHTRIVRVLLARIVRQAGMTPGEFSRLL